MRALKYFFKSYHFITITLFFLLITVIIGKIAARDYVTEGMAIASLPEKNTGPIPGLHSPSTSSIEAQSPPQTIQQPISYTEITGLLKAGDTISNSLKRCGVSDDVREQIIQSYKTVLDFRRLQPGNSYSIILDENGNLVKSVFESSPLEVYSINKTDHGFQAVQNDISLQIKTFYLTGTITTSLFAAFLENNEDTKLIYAFADIFASKIDFNTETQVGDTFRVVFEKYFKNDECIGYGRILYANYSQIGQDNLLEAFYFESEQTAGSYFDREGKELGASFIRSPVPLGRISSRFTFRRKHPILGRIVPHLGVDFASPPGTPVMATGDGKVQFIGTNGGFGKQIVLSHGGNYKTHYGHLARFKRGLRKGSPVKQKEIIGYVGSTGLATGPHLDYRVQHHGVYINPFSMESRPKSILQGEEFAKLQQRAEEATALLDTFQENRILEVKNIIHTPQDSSLKLL